MSGKTVGIACVLRILRQRPRGGFQSDARGPVTDGAGLLLGGVDARCSGRVRYLPVSGRQNLACRQNFDTERYAFGIDIVNERSGLFRQVDLAAPDGDIRPGRRKLSRSWLSPRGGLSFLGLSHHPAMMPKIGTTSWSKYSFLILMAMSRFGLR